MKLRIAAAVASVVILAGCQMSGPEFEDYNVNQIREGVTTKSEVERLLGPPDQSSVDAKAIETWIYFRAPESIGAGRETLVIRFNSGDLVDFIEASDKTGVTAGPDPSTIRDSFVRVDL